MNRFIARSPAPAFCFPISNDKKMTNKRGQGKGWKLICPSGHCLLIEEEIGDFVFLCRPAAW